MKKNPILEILINVIIPVVLLNHLSQEIDPRIALIVVLSIPFSYGLYTYIKSHNKNIFSIIGFINILLTGGLALITFEGLWFAIKEASIPAILGIVVLATRFSKRVAFSWIFYNPHALKIEVIEKRLEERNNTAKFQNHLKRCNDWFAVSFFISALLNFILARYIFTLIDPSLIELEKQRILNKQIADMTWMSQIFVFVPIMVFAICILWYFSSKGLKYIDLPFKDIDKILSKKT